MIAEANFRHNDINSFLNELGEAQDKEKFFKEYVKSVRLNDQKVNSVISLYSNQEILAKFPSTIKIELEKEVKLYFDLKHTSLFDLKTKERL